LKSLGQLVLDNYKYPVDTVLISSEGKLLGHTNVHELTCMDADLYRAFLKKPLVAEGRIPAEEATPEPEMSDQPAQPVVKLTLEEPSATYSGELVCEAFGKPSIQFCTIEIPEMPDGGTVEFRVETGDGPAKCSFELCAMTKETPGYSVPVKSLNKVAAGQTASLEYDFEPGAMLMFTAAAKPADNAEGDRNKYRATITIRKR
jgi:hypothetical protein